MRLKRHNELDKHIVNRPDLVVLAGQSGSGKSTLIDFLRLPEEKVFTASYAMIDEVKRRGQPVNHDTIYSVAQEFYNKDPLWQIPSIMARLAIQGCLVWDGPRRVQEVKAMQERDINTTIVRVAASQEVRRLRLAKRDGTNSEAFSRIVEDEKDGAGIDQLLDMANITIHNNRDIRQLEISSRAIKGLLRLESGGKYES